MSDKNDKKQQNFGTVTLKEYIDSKVDNNEKATVVSLREYIDVRLTALSHVVELKHDALEKATTMAKDSMELRLKGMNEFREQLKDQANTFLPRSEHVLAHKILEEKTSALQDQVNTFPNTFMPRNEFYLAHKVLEAEMAALHDYKIVAEAKASQKSVLIVGALSIIGLIISAIALLVK